MGGLEQDMKTVKDVVFRDHDTRIRELTDEVLKLREELRKENSKSILFG